ncbi:MAG: hypothetical protein AAFX39_12585 [Pseudomonadota bacterium]
MSQFDFGTINPDTKDGTTLASDLGSWRDALNTLHKGAARPSYAQAGMAWVKEVSGTLWELNIYDGSTDIVIATINPSTNVFSLPNGSVGLAALADMATDSFVGRDTAGSGAPEVLSATQARAILNVADGAQVNPTTEELQDLVGAMVTGNTETGITVTYDDVTGTLDFVADAGGAFEDEFLHVADLKGNGVAGGTFTAGAWRTRDMGSELTNLISGASHAGNQITLPAGTYLALGWATGHRVDSHKTRLRNVTDGTDAITGTSEEASDTTFMTSRSMLSGRFTIASTKTFEIQHYCETTRATDGFGNESGFGVNERYADIMIWKVG